MAIRKIIQIDQDKCNGCGLCAAACHEGAIGMVGGKAKLLREDYCDGLGDCLPACPQDAITFVEREAAAYDQAAVAAAQQAKASVAVTPHAHQGGCPSAAARIFEPVAAASDAQAGLTAQTVPSQISTWPIQVKLVAPHAPYFDGCDLLIAADCTAFAYGNFHHDYMAGKVCIIACPKLDNCDYTEKLSQIIGENDIKSITLTRMVVPCCGGLEMMARQALALTGKDIPFDVVTFSLDGRLL